MDGIGDVTDETGGGAAPPLGLATVPRSILVARGVWPLWHGMPVGHGEDGTLILQLDGALTPLTCQTGWRREPDGVWRARCAHSVVEVQESVWCATCDVSPHWPDQEQCYGCLRDRVAPAEVVPMLAVHPALSVAMAMLRQRVTYWEEKHPAFLLVPAYQRLWEESAAPSTHADYGTAIGRKLVQARWTVERRHPRGRRRVPCR